MSFWSDASPITKGLIVVGVLGILYFGVAYFAKLPPFSNTYEQVQQRGIGAG
ncbi:MAG: hypothetical protein IT379_20835 [Deltaproteobacteria bacterium]|nr:hypothetical protein [Deltaproteobacteria bacterium]